MILVNLSPAEVEQLVNIVQNYPVWAGDLISKDAKKSLVEKGLVTYREGNNGRDVSDAERMGGYVPTDYGIEVYMALGHPE